MRARLINRTEPDFYFERVNDELKSKIAIATLRSESLLKNAFTAASAFHY